MGKQHGASRAVAPVLLWSMLTLLEPVPGGSQPCWVICSVFHSLHSANPTACPEPSCSPLLSHGAAAGGLRGMDPSAWELLGPQPAAADVQNAGTRSNGLGLLWETSHLATGREGA